MGLKLPTIKSKVDVKPERSVFSIVVEDETALWGEDRYEFTIDSDGSITLNGNNFNSKQQATQVLEAMLAFLKK